MLELLCRCCCICCIDFTKVNRKPGAEDYLGGGPEEEGGEAAGDGGQEKEKENYDFNGQDGFAYAGEFGPG